jgi:flagellar protein FlaJ
MIVPPNQGSAEQRRAMQLFRLLVPLTAISGIILNSLGLELGWLLVWVAALILPIGIVAMLSDQKTTKKDEEFSTFLRSTGGTATSSGTTLREALTKIDLSSFPTLEPDVVRLSTRLDARIDPDICWHKFGIESGSKLVSEVVSIFYSAIKIGGDPERVGYLCSLFTSKTSQLRAKRRLTAGTFSGLTTVMQGVVAGIMVFVLSIVENFAELVKHLMPTDGAAANGQASLNLGMANFTAAELEFLTMITVTMVLMLAIVSATAIILGDGGYKLKGIFYLSLTVFISGMSFILVPPMVDGILTI